MKKKLVLNAREKVILTICLLMIVAYGVVQWVMKPAQYQYERIQHQIKKQQRRLLKHQEELEAARADELLYEQLYQQFGQEQLDEEVMSAMVRRIEEVAREAGVKISDLKPRPINTETYFRKFLVGMTVDSTFKDMMRFLYLIQQPPDVYVAEEIAFSQSRQRKLDQIKTQLVLGRMIVHWPFDNILPTRHDPSVSIKASDMALVGGRVYPSYATYEQILMQRNLFEGIWQRVQASTAVFQAVGTTPPVALTHKIRLLGIVLDQRPQVIVEELANQQTVFLSPGDVVAEARLEEIHATEVIFMYNDKQVILEP